MMLGSCGLRRAIVSQVLLSELIGQKQHWGCIVAESRLHRQCSAERAPFIYFLDFDAGGDAKGESGAGAFFKYLLSGMS
jgi:hypothetical protein